MPPPAMGSPSVATDKRQRADDEALDGEEDGNDGAGAVAALQANGGQLLATGRTPNGPAVPAEKRVWAPVG